MYWVSVSQKKAFLIVTAVKTSNLRQTVDGETGGQSGVMSRDGESLRGGNFEG
jgi:hypothetical protein